MTGSGEPPMRLATIAVATVVAVVASLPGFAASRSARVCNPTKSSRRVGLPEHLPVVRLPRRVMPSPNAYATYREAYRAIVDESYEQDGDDAPIEQRLAAVEANSRAYALIDAANHQIFEAPPSRSLLTPADDALAEMRSLSRLLCFKSRCWADRNDWAGAADTALAVIQMGAQVQRHAALTQSLVGVGIEAAGRAELRYIIPQLMAQEALGVAVQLRAAEVAKPSYADILLEEKYFSEAALLEMMRCGQDWHQAKGEAYTSAAPPSDQELMDQCQAYFDYAIAQSRRAWPRAKPFFPPGHGVLSSILAFDTRFVFALDRTCNELLAGQALLQRYHATHGKYPETLAGLLAENKIIGTLDDPFSDAKSLRYLRTGDSYTLYSVGPDGADNGGSPIDNHREDIGPNLRHRPEKSSKGDIVAGINT